MGRYPVGLPSRDQGWNSGFHSCNGLSAAADVTKWKDPELWKDVLAVHQRTPLYALVGGGDQIYNDAFWFVPSMKAWLDIPSKEASQTHSCNPLGILSATNCFSREFLESASVW